MTDTGAGGAVTDEQLVEFTERLEGLAKASKASKPKLVLAGDIFDLLRSPKWAKLWREKESAPWSGMAREFRNFPRSDSEEVAIEIARSIANRYSGFSRALRKLVGAGLETIYLPGNHDYMVQLSVDLRRVLVDFLALGHDPGKPFKFTYSEKTASALVMHGNAFDPVNSHRLEDGYWALGDAVVLRIVNRFPEEACQELGVSPSTDLGQRLQDIDNIEPLEDIPLYVRWLAEQLTIKKHREKLLSAWKRVVDEFLAMDEFRDLRGYGRPEFKLVRLGFELSTQLGLAALVKEMAKKFPNAGVNYHQAAENEARKNEDYRFVVFGHTHKPTLAPLGFAPERETRFYVNTGCWRRLVTLTAGNGPTFFASRRVASYFVIDPSARADVRERYHLFQEWHTN